MRSWRSEEGNSNSPKHDKCCCNCGTAARPHTCACAGPSPVYDRCKNQMPWNSPCDRKDTAQSGYPDGMEQIDKKQKAAAGWRCRWDVPVLYPGGPRIARAGRGIRPVFTYGRPPCTVNDTGHPHAVPGPRPKHRCAAGSPGIAAALRLFGGFPGALALIRCARLPPAGGPGRAEM